MFAEDKNTIMSNAVIIRNEKDGDIFIRQLLNIGEAMYRAGGEISRIEDSLHRLGKKYGAKHVSVYAITSSIVLTAEFENDFSVTQIRRITGRGSIDCLKMEKLNQLCRDCERNPISVEELQEKVLNLLKEEPNKTMVYLGQFIAAIAFTFFFGGDVKDAIVAAVGVLVICLMQRFFKPICSAELFFNIITSFVTGVVVNVINLFVSGLHVNQILIGDIMVLIPGIAITNSIRYILSGDIISSFEKLMDSLMQAFGIAAGFMLSLLLINSNLVSAEVLHGPWRPTLQVVAAAFGTLGFSIVFNTRKKHIIVPAIGGMLCWAVYLILQSMSVGVFASTLGAAIVVGVYGEVFTYIIKVPKTILFIPACVPLIPGGNLYYLALAMISSKWDKCIENLVLLSLYAVGIALGLAIVGEVEKMIRNLKNDNR